MTLATHSIVGALVATSLAPVNPALAVVASFGSHFVLDALPHWDYKLGSMSRDEHHPIALTFAKDRRFLIDLLKISCDMGLGLVGTFLVFELLSLPFSIIALMGLLAGVIPDFFQFVYSHFRIAPLRVLQRFHTWIHSDHRLDGRPYVGIGSQVMVVIVCVCLGFWYW